MAFTTAQDAGLERLLERLRVSPGALNGTSVSAADDLAQQLLRSNAGNPYAPWGTAAALEWAAGGNYRQALALIIDNGAAWVDGPLDAQWRVLGQPTLRPGNH